MNFDEIANIAQKISFAFEDHFHDEKIKTRFNDLFNKYLSEIAGPNDLDPYDAIKTLGRKNPEKFEQMVREMKENSLISDKD